jgi:hypothetical protein
VTVEFKRRDGEITAASRVLAERFAERVSGSPERAR